MARLFNMKIFEGWVSGTTVVYTDPALNGQLAAADTLRFQSNPEDVQGTAPVALTVYLQSSGDGLSWENQSAVLNAQTVTAGTSVFGGSGSTTLGGFARLALSTEANKRVYLKVWATGRSS